MKRGTVPLYKKLNISMKFNWGMKNPYSSNSFPSLGRVFSLCEWVAEMDESKEGELGWKKG